MAAVASVEGVRASATGRLVGELNGALTGDVWALRRIAVGRSGVVDDDNVAANAGAVPDAAAVERARNIAALLLQPPLLALVALRAPETGITVALKGRGGRG